MSLGPQPHEEATPMPLPAASGPVVGSRPGHYLGFTARETGGAAAVQCVLYDNASAASGPILEEISLAANGKDDANYPPPGRYVQNGIYAQITGTGVLQGSVFQ